ncbi:gliding motility-associated C-terminal domain-containing protein [Marinoscillum luteum]|uniref:Gliding motility-associated C-terminal domain-containing protein n=1 Tax=Marinoscillum luteum TaxID=861051 RepID=A0ABW7N2V2_9BACT
MKITGTPGIDVTEYLFRWWAGTDTTIAAMEITNAANFGGTIDVTAADSSAIEGLPSGKYTVVAYDANDPYNGCKSVATYTLKEDNPVYQIKRVDIITTDDTNCDNNNANGTIKITKIFMDGIAVDLSVSGGDYAFTWAGLNVGAIQHPVNSVNDSVSSVLPGTYTVYVENLVDNLCRSQVVNVTVGQDGIEPTFDTPVVTEDTYCTGGNGSVTLAILAPDTDEANYDFSWYEGTGTAGTFRGDLSGVGNFSATNLNAGFYTIVVTAQATASEGTGCTDMIVVEVEDNPDVIKIAANQIVGTPITDCSPHNGQVVVNNVTLNGALVGTAGYTFTLYESDGVTPSASTFTGASTSADLSPGTYFVSANDAVTGCTTPLRSVIIDYDTEQPTLSIALDRLNSSCDVANADGQLTLSITGADMDANYTIDWYLGTVSNPGSAELLADGVPSAGGFTPSITISGTTPPTSTISGLATARYFARVTDTTNPNANCNNVIAKSVLQDSTFAINMTLTANSQTNCTANGEVVINSITLTTQDGPTSVSGEAVDGGVANLIGTYDLQLLNANQQLITAVTTDADLQGLSEGNYFINATHQVYDCESNSFPFQIVEDIAYPETSVTTIEPNTSCTTTGVGSIEITLLTDGVANAYTVDWRNGSLPTSPAVTPAEGTASSSANTFTLSGLSAGNYTAVISDVTSGCSVNFTYEVLENLSYPTINIPDGQVTHNTLCGAGNGAVTIDDNDITYQGAAGLVADYDWTITSSIGQAGFPQVLNAPAAISLSNLLPDTITFLATHRVTGCSNGSLELIILDKSRLPEIDSLVMIPNANCDGGGIAQGLIEIREIDGIAPSAGNYDYQWYVGTSASAGNEVSVVLGESDSTELVQNLPDDFYTVEITNNNTGCVSTQTIEVQNDPDYPIIISYEVNKNLTCFTVGNGSFVITQIRYQGTDLSMGNSADSLTIVSDYTLLLFASDGVTPMTDGDPATTMKLDSLSAGTYYAAIRKNDSNCDSEKVQFVIKDNPFYPQIQIIQVEADSTCSETGTTPNGMLLAIPDNANDPIHIDSSYTFNWYEVDPGTNARITGSISSNDTLSGQYQGKFEVEVVNVNVGCLSNAYFTLTNEPEELRIVAIDSVSMTACSPSNAFFEVTMINIGNLTDYTYYFYNGDPTIGNPNDSLIYSGPSPILSFNDTGFDVVPDEYYVIAVSNITGCSTDIYQIEITDETTRPGITLEAFSLQTNCDPDNPNGSLTVSANGSQDNTLYTFEWTNSAGIVVEANNATADSLAADTYTVTITEVATGCSVSENYTMIDDYPDPLKLSVTSEGNSNCVNPDGRLAAKVNNIPDGKSASDYQFYWFIGDQTAGTPDPTQADWIGTVYSGLEAGTYTVYVVDGTDAFCTSVPRAVTVKDLRDTPDFRVDIINDVTICYPTLPNGRATIGFTEGELFRYTFLWYEGAISDTTGLSPFVSNKQSVDSLNIGVYTTAAIDKITGCIGYQQFNIMDATETVGLPTLVKVSDRTNCIYPDGRALARVNGNTEGYTFNWYEQGNLTTPVFTGSDVSTLDTTTYLVEAIKISTGCVSARVSVEILNGIEDPEFEVFTTGSICLRTEDGAANQFNGTADIYFEVFHEIDTISWINPDGISVSSDVKLIGAEPGIWSVWFRSDNGCDYTREFEITAALKIYNGISSNGDGKNDFMIIDCIDYFPNNRVSIYNRDGSLVYETKGYNNIDRRFDGTSNVGRNGLKLPVGTYFYFIDKGDGTEVVNGYLELVR